ncbi:MAG: four helix bundle protein [Saprospiraceae bacterium]
MDYSNLKKRFLDFALAVHELTKEFPKEDVYFNIKNQITRCSSSSGANYRAASRGKSPSDFINKLKMVEEELDESLYWLQYLNGVDKKWILLSSNLIKEGNELLSIIVASLKTARKNQESPLKYKMK